MQHTPDAMIELFADIAAYSLVSFMVFGLVIILGIILYRSMKFLSFKSGVAYDRKIRELAIADSDARYGDELKTESDWRKYRRHAAAIDSVRAGK
tara:strand:- start:1623 stop:1907 length:285 start_codon:yes stop_codon:yes gene_type:complete